MIVIDTSALIEIVKGTERGIRIKERIGDDKISTTSITLNEVLVNSKGKEKEVLNNFLESIDILPFDKKSSLKSIEVENDLSAKGKMIGKLNIFIASICLAKNLPIVTLDGDFNNVKGLKIVS